MKTTDFTRALAPFVLVPAVLMLVFAMTRPAFAQPPVPAKVPNALRSTTPLIQATDFQASLKFYTEILGFEVTKRGGDTYAILQRDGCRLALSRNVGKIIFRVSGGQSDVIDYAAYDIYLYCNRGTVGQLFREIKNTGTKIPTVFANGPVDTPYGFRGFSVTDPGGNGIVFCEDIEPPDTDSAERLPLVNRTLKIQADNSVMVNSKFHNVDMSGTVFDDINLSKASFNNINLTKSKFTDVNLTGATFEGCDLTGVAFKNCTITGMTIDGVDVAALAKK